MAIIQLVRDMLNFIMEYNLHLHIILLINLFRRLVQDLNKLKEAIATQMMDYFVYKILEKIVINHLILIALRQMELIQ